MQQSAWAKIRKLVIRGPRFRAVMDGDGNVRLWCRRSKKMWILFHLDFSRTRKSTRHTFHREAAAMLAVEPDGSKRSTGKEIFADLNFFL